MCDVCCALIEGTSRPSKYCSARCKATAKKRRQVARWREDPTRVCTVEGCGGFRGCGDFCAAHYKRARAGDFGAVLRELVRDRDPICTATDCGRPHVARGFCAWHWKVDAAERGVEWAVEYMEGGGGRRRAERYGVEYEFVDRAEIFERDGYICQLCGEDVDPAVKFPDSRAATVDHVVPISRGGDHVASNLALAHFSCNAAKGNRVAVAA